MSFNSERASSICSRECPGQAGSNQRVACCTRSSPEVSSPGCDCVIFVAGSTSSQSSPVGPDLPLKPSSASASILPTRISLMRFLISEAKSPPRRVVMLAKVPRRDGGVKHVHHAVGLRLLVFQGTNPAKFG